MAYIKGTFRVLQIYMVLKHSLNNLRIPYSFGGLQIYMTLKRIVERGEKVETFEVLQIYMTLKLEAYLMMDTTLHDSQTIIL